MRFKVRKEFVEVAGLNDGIYFAEDNNLNLRIVGKQKRDGLIPIMIKREGSNYIFDIPDAIVQKLKHREGSEIDFVPEYNAIYVL